MADALVQSGHGPKKQRRLRCMTHETHTRLCMHCHLWMSSLL